MSQLHLQLVTPKGTLFNESFESISIPTATGQITILPGHTRLVSAIQPGELIVRNKGHAQYIHVDGGFAEIKDHSEVVILADAAAHIAELNEAQILEAKSRAEQLLKQENMADEEYARAAASLELNLSKLRTVRRHAHRTRRPITSEGVMNE